MKKLAWIVAPLLVAGALAGVACTSSTNGSGGNGTSSGGGTITGAGACVVYFDDAGNVADAGTPGSCLITAVNGTNTSGPPCSQGLTYATSCPTAGLVGCCTTRGNSDSNTVVLIDQCAYAITGQTAAQLQELCESSIVDGGAVGTWSTTP